MSKTFLTFVLFAGLFLTFQNGVMAQDAPGIAPMIKNLPAFMTPEPEPSGPFPDAALGIWSAPDCTDAQNVLVLSQYYQLSLKPARHSITAITQWRSEDYDGEKLFFYLTHDTLGYFFKMTNDGLIRHLRHFVHPKQDLHTAWDDIIAQMSDEYTRCTKLFTGKPVVTQDEVNLPFLLDRIKAPCTGVDPDHFSNAGACHSALFSTLDSNQDSALDEKELVRFYQQAVFLEEGALPGCRITESAGVTFPEMSDPAAATRFAAESLTLADTDNNSTLSQEEAIRALNNPLSLPLKESLLQKLRSARFALGFLPMSNAEKTCSAGAPGGKPEAYTGVIILDSSPSPLSLDGAGGCGCGG